MGLGDLEFTLVVLFVVSVGFYVHGKHENLHDQAMMASRAAFVSLLGAVACAYPLGWYHLRDLFPVAGLGFVVFAARRREDHDLSRLMVQFGAACMILWVIFYQMSWTQYGISAGLAMFDAFVVYRIIRHWNWGNPTGDGHQTGQPRKVRGVNNRLRAMMALSNPG